MKAIIIENEYDIDESVQAFLKDNPNLFSEVQEELYCLHRSAEDLVPEVLKNDAIIVASTWMYKDQLENFLDGFLREEFPPKKIFAHDIVRHLNDWIYTRYSSDRVIAQKVVDILAKGFTIYSFYEDWDSDKVVDDLNIFHKEKERYLYTYKEVKYSSEHQFFYIEGEEDSIVEEKQKLIKT